MKRGENSATLEAELTRTMITQILGVTAMTPTDHVFPKAIPMAGSGRTREAAKATPRSYQT